MSDKNQGIYNNINKFINESLNMKNIYIYAIVLICILYILTVYNKTTYLLNNEIVRVGLLILIMFITSKSIYIGLVMTLIILAIMQIVTFNNIDDELKSISEIKSMSETKSK
jgi:hypothetical protein